MPSKFTKEFIEKLQEDYDSGYTMRALIEKYNTSFDSLNKYLDARTTSEAMQLASKNNRLGGCCTKEYWGTEKHIKSARRGGGFRINAGRGKGVHFKNIKGDQYYLRSSFEVKVAEWLNQHNILWKQPTPFFYFLDGIKKRYYPDFILPKHNIIIETKNDYLMSIQQEKMKAVKEISEIPIHILTNEDIKNLDEIMKFLVG